MPNIQEISKYRKQNKNSPVVRILKKLESFLRTFVFHSPLLDALFPRFLFLDGSLFLSLHIWSIIFLTAKIITIFEITKINSKKFHYFLQNNVQKIWKCQK